MRWAFSLSEDRIQTIEYAFNRRVYGTSVSPATPFHAEGNRVLRDQVFTTTHFPVAPSIPSDSAGMAGQDPFDSQWAARSNYPPSSTQDRHVHSPPSDPTVRHTRAPPHPSPVSTTPHAEMPARSWDNSPWMQSGANSIPAAKLQRLSPDEIEAQQQLHRVSPPSASSSASDFHQTARYPPTSPAGIDVYHDSRQGQPFDPLQHRSSSSFQIQQQWDGVDNQLRREYSDSSLPTITQGTQFSHAPPPFVRIEGNASMGYHSENNFQPQRHHDGTHHSLGYAHHHIQHGGTDTHSDEGSVNDVLYMADSQLNRTRYPQEFMESTVYKS